MSTNAGANAISRPSGYVYFWADGIYFRPRLDHDKQCLLVIIGADEGGNKDIVGLSDG